jgi:hypothetical protein
MLTPGPAQRVVIHLNEDAASEGDYLHVETSPSFLPKGLPGQQCCAGILDSDLTIAFIRRERPAAVANTFQYELSSSNPLRL